MKLKAINKKKKIIIISIVVIAVLVGSGFGYKSVFAKSDEFDLTATYGQALIGDISIDVYGDGNLESGYSKTINSTTTITIDKANIIEGAYVSKGDVIAYLDKEEMQNNFDILTQEINAFQQSISDSYKESDILYIKSPIDGRLKDVKVEEGDLVEDAMEEFGYFALVVEDRMKIVVGEQMYSELIKSEESLVLRTVGYKYKDDDVYLDIVGEDYCVVLDTAKRDEGVASIYYSSNTSEGNEIFTGELKFINPIKLTCNYGEITLVDDAENNTLDKGEVLYHVEQYSYTLDNDLAELEQLQNEYYFCKALLDTGQLTAPISGMYTSINIEDGRNIARDEKIAVIFSNEDWQATVAVDELDVSDVEVGQKAVITVDALDGQEFEAIVSDISVTGMASGGITTYDVSISAENNPAFKIAMTISAEIQIDGVYDVVTVPTTAIKTMGNRQYVIVKSERSSAEISEIKRAITDSNMQILMKYMGVDTSAMGNMSETENSNKENVQAESKSNTSARSGRMMITSATDLLFGTPVFIETGLSDAGNIEVISGLDGSEKILLATVSNAEVESSSTEKTQSSIPVGLTSGTGGGQRPGGGGK